MTDSSLDILVVDDSKVVRTFTVRTLEKLGFTNFRQAEDGQVALDRCGEKMPQLIILDWHMPVMTGPECLTSLRKMPGGEQPQVIFCTTETDFNNIAHVMAEGANEYIFKPYDEAILKDKLSQLGVISD